MKTIEPVEFKWEQSKESCGRYTSSSVKRGGKGSELKAEEAFDIIEDVMKRARITLKDLLAQYPKE